MPDKATSKRVWMALAIVYVIWGSTYLAIAVAVETIPPFLMAGTRFVIAAGILFLVAGRFGNVEGDHLGWRQWGAATVVGGLLLVGGNGGLAWAEQRVDTGVAALIIATVPIWMVVLATFMREERVSARIVAGLLLGFAGTALLVRAAGAGDGGLDPVGLVVLLASSLCWAAGSVLSRRMPLPGRPLVSTSMQMLAGGVLLLALGAALEEFRGLDPAAVSAHSLAGLGYLIVFGSLVAFSAFVWVVRNAPPSLVSTYAYVNPVVAVFLGWLVLREPVTAPMLLAAGLVIGAVALIVAKRGQPAPRPARGRDRATGPSRS